MVGALTHGRPVETECPIEGQRGPTDRRAVARSSACAVAHSARAIQNAKAPQSSLKGHSLLHTPLQVPGDLGRGPNHLSVRNPTSPLHFGPGFA